MHLTKLLMKTILRHLLDLLRSHTDAPIAVGVSSGKVKMRQSRSIDGSSTNQANVIIKKKKDVPGPRQGETPQPSQHRRLLRKVKIKNRTVQQEKKTFRLS